MIPSKSGTSVAPMILVSYVPFTPMTPRRGRSWPASEPPDRRLLIVAVDVVVDAYAPRHDSVGQTS